MTLFGRRKLTLLDVDYRNEIAGLRRTIASQQETISNQRRTIARQQQTILIAQTILKAYQKNDNAPKVALRGVEEVDLTAVKRS